jgi:hypothetical protein
MFPALLLGFCDFSMVFWFHGCLTNVLWLFILCIAVRCFYCYALSVLCLCHGSCLSRFSDGLCPVALLDANTTCYAFRFFWRKKLSFHVFCVLPCDFVHGIVGKNSWLSYIATCERNLSMEFIHENLTMSPDNCQNPKPYISVRIKLPWESAGVQGLRHVLPKY